jgi:PAS domain S-box-containing protein
MQSSAPDSRSRSWQWVRVSLRTQGVAALLVPLAALFAVLGSVFWMNGDVREADQAVVAFYDTRTELARLRSSLADAGIAATGFSATGQRQYLASFEAARKAAREALNRLPSLVGNDPAAVAEMNDIQSLSAQDLAFLARAANAGPGAGAASVDRARGIEADVAARIGALSEEKERQFQQARGDRDLKRQKLFRTVLICGFVGPLGALLMQLLVAGRLVRRIQAVQENARRMAHGLPLQSFPAGADEIADLARQIEDAAYLLNHRERELAGSERRYRDLFDQAPVPYEETDINGVVRRFNQAVCTLLRCTPDQILGCKAWDFVAPDQKDEIRDAMLKRIATGMETGAFECEYLLEEGSSITVEIRENLIRDETGTVTGTCRSLTDVTERNLAAVAARKVEQYAMELRNKNEQLARALDAARTATEAKSRFLASVSHELRTPLNGIIGFSELMYDEKVGPASPEQRECLSDILTSGRHLLRLINDILDLSKVEAGKMEFRPEPVELGDLVREVRDVIRPLAEKKDLQLTCDMPARLSAVLDPGRFKQVLYNYLSNAVKFTPAGGSVQLRVTLVENEAFRVEVEDTGVGIPAVEISKLFQEFQQLPNSRKAEQGTGLGLALTRHIVQAQGGSVAVRSTPGRGSVFSAVLPLAPRTAAAKAV